MLHFNVVLYFPSDRRCRARHCLKHVCLSAPPTGPYRYRCHLVSVWIWIPPCFPGTVTQINLNTVLWFSVVKILLQGRNLHITQIDFLHWGVYSMCCVKWTTLKLVEKIYIFWTSTNLSVCISSPVCLSLYLTMGTPCSRCTWSPLCSNNRVSLFVLYIMDKPTAWSLQEKANYTI